MTRLNAWDGMGSRIEFGAEVKDEKAGVWITSSNLQNQDSLYINPTKISANCD